MTHTPPKVLTDADRNWRRFVLFRVLFNSRFYYPVLAVLFLDLGLTATEYTLLNFAWALAIVFTDLPAGALADMLIACFIGWDGLNAAHSNRRSAWLTAPNRLPSPRHR